MIDAKRIAELKQWLWHPSPKYYSTTTRDDIRRDIESILNDYEAALPLLVARDKDERILRELLWRRHGCSGLYGDDGEMQCSACAIDFKRETPPQIQARFHQIGESKYLQAIKDGWHWTLGGMFVPPEKERSGQPKGKEPTP